MRNPSHSSSNRARITDSNSILDLFSNCFVGDVDFRFQDLTVGLLASATALKPLRNECILDFLLSFGELLLGFLRVEKRF